MPETARQSLLYREDDPNRPSLENRVAYQWEPGLDTLGYRNGQLRDQTVLHWAADALASAARPAGVLDIGCCYGNLLFMLNALTGCDDRIQFVGIDIDERGVAYGKEFSESVQGYGNCDFIIHDVTTSLPLADDSLDVVVAADVLEHLPDVPGTLREIDRVLRSSGCLIISTPLAHSVYKRLAVCANVLSRGRLNRSYYRGKNTDLDKHGEPVMVVHAGHDHISEMRYVELIEVLSRRDLYVENQQLTPIMSGSTWFDTHPFLLAGLMTLEAIHSRLQRPSWAHGICLELRKRG